MRTDSWLILFTAISLERKSCLKIVLNEVTASLVHITNILTHFRIKHLEYFKFLQHPKDE